MKRIPYQLFFIIFYTGALFGLFLTIIAAWADYEAASYGFVYTGGERLSALNCPILLTANETGSFSVKVSNTTNRKISPSVKADISTHLTPITSYTSVPLASGESKLIKWTIGPENLEFGRFIFVHVLVPGYYPQRNHENVCGVFIVNLPGSGRVITWTVMGLSLLEIGIGLYGITKSQTSVQDRQTGGMWFNFAAALVLAGIVTSFMGLWLWGILIVVISLLLIVVTALAVRR